MKESKRVKRVEERGGWELLPHPTQYRVVAGRSSPSREGVSGGVGLLERGRDISLHLDPSLFLFSSLADVEIMGMTRGMRILEFLMG